MGPIGLPFQRTSTAPAFPTLSIATSSPVSVLVWLGCRIPEKIGLPSLVMESQVLSVAERFSSTRFTPSVPGVVVTAMVAAAAAGAVWLAMGATWTGAGGASGTLTGVPTGKSYCGGGTETRPGGVRSHQEKNPEHPTNTTPRPMPDVPTGRWE